MKEKAQKINLEKDGPVKDLFKLGARTLKGVVVSDKMQKTAIVAITRLTKHPKIKKYFKITNRFKAHNEDNKYKTGDEVIMRETRPISRDKRWVIVDKVK